MQAAEPLPPTEPQDSGQTAEALLRLELLLNLSFGSCVVLYVGFFVTGIAMVKAGPSPPLWMALLGLLLFFGSIAAYLWFVVQVTITARRLGNRAGLFLAWMIVAPLLALLPIPILSQIIAASPLSLKFLLSNQLRAEIRSRSFLIG